MPELLSVVNEKKRIVFIAIKPAGYNNTALTFPYAWGLASDPRELEWLLQLQGHLLF